MKCDDSKKIALYCSLDWLNNFIDFLREDFLSLIKKTQVRQSQARQSLASQEESKEQLPIPDKGGELPDGGKEGKSKHGIVLDEQNAQLL
jgi:hypothetical protein